MSYDGSLARRYDEWSAHMPEDIAFYVELARAEPSNGSPDRSLPAGDSRGTRSPSIIASAELDGRHGDEPEPHTIR